MKTIQQFQMAVRPVVLALGAAGVAALIAGCSDATGKAAEAQTQAQAGPKASAACRKRPNSIARR